MPAILRRIASDNPPQTRHRPLIHSLPPAVCSLLPRTRRWTCRDVCAGRASPLAMPGRRARCAVSVSQFLPIRKPPNSC